MTKEEAKKHWEDREVGAIWVGDNSLKIKMKDRDGNKVELVAFKNRFKSEKKHPDWRLYKSIELGPPIDAVSVPATAVTPQKPEAESSPPKVALTTALAEAKKSEDEAMDDVPF
jgi:hypothetical protein